MLKKFLLSSLILLPVLSFAQDALDGTNAILGGISGIVAGTLIPLVFTLALLFFFYGVAKYIWQEGAGKEDGKKIMIWGIVALFVMSSVWGLVRFIQGELGITENRNMNVPTIDGVGGSGSGGAGGGSGSGGSTYCNNDPVWGNCP